MDWTGKPVAVIGAGESGVASVKLLAKLGARVRVSSMSELPETFRQWCERRRIPVETGGHTDAFLAVCGVLVVSPGVKPDSPVIRGARKRGASVWSEIELAWRAAPEKIAAVTGTNGKTTTSTLLWEMIRRHRPCDLCGNIGRSFSGSVLRRGVTLDRVVEVSSFQMKFIERFRPEVAVVLNLSPNHLDWHPDLQDYYRSKLRVGANQTKRQTLVLNADDPELRRRSRALPGKKLYFSLGKLRNGLTVENGWIVCRRNGRGSRIAGLEHFRLAGRHNIQNALAAAAAALALGVPSRCIEAALRAARPLPHRVEALGEVRGVRFVNDSKSTTAMSTVAAIRGFERGVILLAGGRRKQDSFKEAYPEVRERVERLIFFGEAGESMSREFAFFKNRTVVRTLEEAVRLGFSSARSGQALLLSPMCSSFDQFSSYRARGDAFRSLFNLIQNEERKRD